MHAYGQLLLVPWGFTDAPPPNLNDLMALAKKVNADINIGITIT